jgi:hypothetical protein
LKYLGHLISENTFRPDPEYVRALRDFPRPKNVKELRSFLGLLQFYRQFVFRLSEMAVPLYQLLRNGVSFSWQMEQEDSFLKLKNSLANKLVMPDFSKKFTLETDAFLGGLGAIVSQDHGVIAYASRTLSKSEGNYPSAQLEALCLVWAFQKVRHLLWGSKNV